MSLPTTFPDTSPIALYAFTPQGLALAVRIAALLEETDGKSRGSGFPNQATHRCSCDIYAAASLQERYGGDSGNGNPAYGVRWFNRFKEQLSEGHFHAYSTHIVIAATGIVVRSIAPFLRGKDVDPAVLVLDQAGRFVISLLSGHLGGANQMACKLAKLLDATPVVTTATDVEALPALDALAQERGLGIYNLKAIQAVSAALLAGERIGLYDRDNLLGIRDTPLAEYFYECPLEKPRPGPTVIVENTTDVIANLKGQGACQGGVRLLVNHCERQDQDVLLVPRLVYAGIGCKRNTPESDIATALHAACTPYGLSVVKAVGSIAAKADEHGMLDFARHHKLAIHFLSPEQLRLYPAINRSPKATELFGVRGVCEPAALALAGPPGAGVLLQAKVAVGAVTTALAIAAEHGFLFPDPGGKANRQT